MEKLTVARLTKDMQAFIDHHALHRTPRPFREIVGKPMFLRKPYGPREIDKINEVLQYAQEQDMEISYHETAGRCSILAYHPHHCRT